MKKLLLTSTAVVILAAGSVHAETIIGFEAESGTLGSQFDPALANVDALGGFYITTETDNPGTIPGSDAFTASYTFDLPAGTYDVYVRGRQTGANDDSFYYAKAFGDADPTVADDWQLMNGGFGVPSTGFGWSNVLSSTLTSPGGTVVWEIGAREDGFLIDAFAFVPTGQSVTDTELDNAVTVPETSSPTLTDFTYNASTGDSEVSIKGSANTAYKVVEADDLDFTTSDPVTLTGATVGNLSGNEVTTDESGNATVQFSLGTDKDSSFIRAETP